MANEIFENMGFEYQDFVSWRAMISCFLHNGLRRHVVGTFINRIEFGVRPDEFCFADVIQVCANADDTYIWEILFGFVIKSGYFESGVCVGCAPIDLFARGFGVLDTYSKIGVR